MSWVGCRSCRDEGLLGRSSECLARMDVGWTYGGTDPVQLSVSQGMAGAGVESDRPSEINDQYCFPLQIARVVSGSSGVGTILSTPLYKASLSHSHVSNNGQALGPQPIRLFAAAMEAKLCVLLSHRFLLSFNPFTVNHSRSPI